MAGWEFDALLTLVGCASLGLAAIAMRGLVRSLRDSTRTFPRWALAGFLSIATLAVVATWLSERFVETRLGSRLALEASDVANDLQGLVDHAILATDFAGASIAGLGDAERSNEVLTEAREGHPEIVALDFTSQGDDTRPRHPRIDALLARATDQRKTALSELVSDEQGGSWQVWLVHPVSGRSADGVSRKLGFITGVVDVPTMLASALGNRADSISLSLAGRVEGGAIREVLTLPEGGCAPDARSIESREEIHVAGQRWHLRVQPGPSFAETGLDRLPWLVLGIGLLMALLVGWVLDDMERRHRALHQLVKARDRQLEDTERSFTTIVDAAPDGVLVVTRAEGLILDVNARMAEMLGAPADALAGEGLSKILVDHEPSAVEQTLERVLDQESRTGRFVLFRHQGGETVELECSGASLVFQGRPAILIMARDVSAVERARRVAKAAGRAQEQFLSSVSHEIRTPLNGIIGLTSLLKDEELTGQGRVQVETLEKCAQELLTTMTDALDFSRLGSGNVKLEKAPFDPRELVSRTLRHLAPRASAKGLLLVDALRSDLPTSLVGDPESVQKILLILVGNAIKFTSEGEVALRIWRNTQEEGQPSELCIEVSDTGAGISEAMREKIFQPFVQSDGSVTREEGGTGLGLAILSQTLLALGGSCELESEEGRGSTFTVKIPIGEPEDAAPPPHAPQLLGRVALVMHPRPCVQNAISELLLSLGVRAMTTSAWRPARDAARRASQQDSAIELLLVDADALDSGSDELSSLLEYAAPGTRVVALDRHARLERAQGVDETLVLPASLALVRRLLLKMLVAQSPSESIDALRERIRGRRVLVVEDNVVNERLLAATLVKTGLKVITAHNGLEAVERLERESVDLVLMDVQMPVLDGLEATRRIRRMPRHRRLPIIALTAQARIEDHEDCLAAGMNDYLAKPATPDDLVSTLLRWLIEEGREESALDASLEESRTW